MAISAAGIIFSNLNNNTLSRLTKDRTVAAIPFACRYRLIDFALSDLVNAGIFNIHVVANYSYRSLVEHIGSGKDWDLARRKGGVNVISPYQTATNASASVFSTHMEALKSMRDYIEEFTEDYVVLMDSDTVLNIDIADVIAAHEQSGANITMVTRRVSEDYTSKHPRLMVHSEGGRVDDMLLSARYDATTPELVLNIFVMRSEHLLRIINEAETHGYNSLTAMMRSRYNNADYRTYCYDGFAACVSSVLDYYKYSIQLATDAQARESLLGQKTNPIFTRVHNSAPSIYTATAKVENSMIADDCIIEGTVINSVISRGVHIERGAVVKNSILFKETRVGKNASVNCVLTDKDVTITDGVVLSGNENMPFFIQKGRKI